uniref:hypoxia-inducible factor-proline dioxygenase n=1 Tax=Sinonovacula constricta TaxID=98310 RepID=A0AA96EMN4_SINCO|nr:prolyl 4-hydroxylase 2B [Sinonovacula constricta]
MDAYCDTRSALCCSVCNSKENLKRCGFCKSSFYCSRDCQLKDWSKHKQFCLQQRTENETKKQNNTTTGLITSPSENIRNQSTDDDGCCCKENTSPSTGRGHQEQLHDAGIEFDTRPYKHSDFTKLSPKISTQDIARIAVETLNKQGHCVLDGVFSKTQIQNARIDIDASRENGKFEMGRLAGGRTSAEQDKQIVNNNIRSDEIYWVEGSEESLPGVRYIVSTMDKILIAFNDYLDGRYFINGRTKAMLACYPGNGTYYRRHVDNPNKDGRVVTCILYLNENWDAQKDGGVLRVLPSNAPTYVDVAPVANRLLFFWSDRRNPHEVQPAFKTRYAITVWYMDETERNLAKQDLAKEEQVLSDKRGEYELAAHKKEKAELCQKIEDAAEKAIALLSLDELKAMSTVLVGQPDPESILGQLGIAPHIRGKLLKRLQKL